MPTPRNPLRADVHRTLLDRIVRSKYPPGERLRDTDLAEDLEVSRTPVREALLRLEREGFVESRQGRGFTVRPLTSEEVCEVYPLIGSMETLALRTGGPLSPDDLSRMKVLASAIESSRGDVAARTDLDTEWHATLLGGCTNQRLLTLLSELKQVVRRYELAYMEVESWVTASAQDHREIVRALATGGPRAAIPLLERHWKFGMEAVLERIA